MAQQMMPLLEVTKQFGTEALCRQHLYNMRWPKGFVCPKWGVVDDLFNIKSRNLYQSKHYSRQASVTAGTNREGGHSLLWSHVMELVHKGLQDKDFERLDGITTQKYAHYQVN